MEKRSAYQEQMNMMFDDRRLIGIARTMFYASSEKPKNQDELRQLFHKTTLTMEERNKVLLFMDDFKSSATSLNRPISMATMKNEILAMIAFKDNYNHAANTVSRPELQAIYQFMIDNREKFEKKN